MSSSVSPHFAGEPAPSSGDTKQDPRAESDKPPHVDPNKRKRKKLGDHKMNHGNVPELYSREKN
jgi:hypothetical protein